MLDYEKYALEADLDFELRYTNLRLRNSGDLADVIRANASAASASVWARRRVSTGWVALDRPVRYVVEGRIHAFPGQPKGSWR